jgi:hypothetical protein
LSSALAAIKQPKHFFAYQVVHFYYGCVVEGRYAGGAGVTGKASDELRPVHSWGVAHVAMWYVKKQRRRKMRKSPLLLNLKFY